MPSAIGHPDLRELLQEEMVKTKSVATSSMINTFFIGKWVFQILFCKVKTWFECNYRKTIYISNFRIN